jgi:lipopolysaccharide export system permease protein
MEGEVGARIVRRSHSASQSPLAPPSGWIATVDGNAPIGHGLSHLSANMLWDPVARESGGIGRYGSGMKLIGRYVFRQAVGAMLLILLSLTGVTWIAVALRQLDVVTGQGQTTRTFLAMTTLALPHLMALIAPIALLIAAIHVLNRLNADSELIVMTAAGAPVWTMLRPLLLLAVIVSAALSVVNHWVAPWSQRLLLDLAAQVRADLFTQVLQPGRFTNAEPNVTLHIRDRTLNGELLGLLMHDARDPKAVSSYLADRGQLVKQGSATFLLMETGHIVRRAEGEQASEIIAFQKYAVDLNRFEQKATDAQNVTKPRERYTSEIMYPPPGDSMMANYPQRYLAEMHERFASPLYPIAFVLIAIAAVGQARTTRQNRVKSVIAAFTLGAVLRLAGIGGANLVAISPSRAPLLYTIPLAAILTAAAVTSLNLRPRRTPKAALWLGAQARRVKAALPALHRPAPFGHRPVAAGR